MIIIIRYMNERAKDIRWRKKGESRFDICELEEEKKAAKNLEWIEANVSSNYPGLNFDFFVYTCFIAVHRCRFVVGFSEDGMGIRKCKKTIPSSRRARRKEAQRGRVRKQKSQSSKINEALFIFYFSLFSAAHIELRAELRRCRCFFFIFCNLMWMWENFFPKKTWNLYQNTILSHLIASRLLCWLTGQSCSSCTTLILISRILRLRVEAKKRDSLNSSHRRRRLFAAALEREFLCVPGSASATSTAQLFVRN